MPLINTSVPNLIQGVSQQPDATRYAGQCEEQINALSSVADGLKKRPNTRHVAKLMSNALDQNSFVHFIDRSETEKYVLIQEVDPNDLTKNILKTFNAVTGIQCTINGAAFIELESGDYLNSSDPNNTTRALTVADTTFLNNNTVVPQKGLSRSPASQKEAIVVVTQGDYSTNYIVKLSSSPILTGGASPAGTAATFNPPALEEITPNTVPPLYKLVSTQFGISPTNSPLASGGVGYDANNSEIFVSSTDAILQLPQIEAGLTGDAISRLDLISNGEFAASVGSVSNFNFTVYCTTSHTGSVSSGRYTGVQDWTLQISGQDLTDYNAAGRPTIDFLLNKKAFNGQAQGGLIEVKYTSPVSVRTLGTFTDIQFSASGFATGSKTYANVNFNTGWIPYQAGFAYPAPDASWYPQVHANTTSTSINYVAPVVTLSATAPTGGTAGTVEGSITSSPDQRDEINSDFIGTQLKNQLITNNSAALFFIAQDQNILIVRPTSPTTQEFYVSSSDGLANTGLQLLYKEVASISDLPVYCKNGFKIKVQGDASFSEDDYYVEFATNDNATFGTGVWNESIGFDVLTQLDSTTMPHGLINVGFDEFVFNPFNGSPQTAPNFGEYIFNRWADKTAGDNESNPFSSFVGELPITAMTLFKNRLCFASGSSISFSEAGSFFNFSRLTVRSLLDSAPIDVSVSAPQVTDITACTSFQGDLILFSDRIQLKLAGGDILTPKTVSVAPITQFAYQSQTPPIVMGSYIYYPFNRGGFSGINEFSINSSTDVYNASAITEHIPYYIPSDINIMTSSTAEDLLVVANKGSNEFFMYVYFWDNNQKVLSSWSKFVLNDSIEGLSFVDSDLKIITSNTTTQETHLVSLPLQAGLVDDSGYNVLLDDRIEVRRPPNSNALEVKLSNNTWVSAPATLPYKPADASEYSFVTAGGVVELVSFDSNSGWAVLNSTQPTDYVYGYLGHNYVMSYKFSTQVFKAAASKGSSPSAASAMHLRNGSVFFDKTNSFDVKVKSEERAEVVNTFLADLDPNADTINSVPFSEGFYRFPVHSKAKHAEITIENSSPFECKFNSAEFESFVKPRSSRYGI